VDWLRSAPVAQVAGGVTDDPFVVDRVVVAQDDRDRDPSRYDQPSRSNFE
jgi:hypothetical protein